MSMEIAVGVARRDLPLFSCSYILHRLRVSDAAYVVQLALGCLPLCRLSFSFAWWRAGLAETSAGQAVAVVGGGAERDPLTKQTRVTEAAAG
jgi:hypothetical protein